MTNKQKANIVIREVGHEFMVSETFVRCPRDGYANEELAHDVAVFILSTLIGSSKTAAQFGASKSAVFNTSAKVNGAFATDPKFALRAGIVTGFVMQNIDEHERQEAIIMRGRKFGKTAWATEMAKRRFGPKEAA